VTEDMPKEKVVTWSKLSKLQEEVTEKYPNIMTSLTMDKLVMDDKVITWDQKKKKLNSSNLYFIPKKSKNR
jgi:hypothetical protein